MIKQLCLTAVLILVTVLASNSSVAQKMRPAAPEIAADAWILVDANTGTVLLENNADEQLPPASLAKMMTTYLVSNEIAEQRLTEDFEVLVSDNAWELGGAKTDGSTMFLSPRSKVSVIDLMHGVIIQSGNDAAIALAEHVAGGEYAFADLMNQQAEVLGMTNTQYMNATGLPAEGMFTSARDLSILASAIIRDHPKYYSIYAKKYFQHNNINQPNRNRLLWRDKTVDGFKTGRTDEAGYCLVSSAKRRDMRLIAVVLGAKDDESRARESQRLLSYGFRYFDTQVVYSAGEVIKANAKLWYGEEEFLNLTVADDVVLTFPRGSEKNFQAQVTLDKIIKAPIVSGQILGQLNVSLGENSLVKIPLVATKDIEASGIFSQLIDWVILFFTDLLS
ncbi:MAG TPA: serine-type D-Ala-D-Ala carboxypeptidase [Porticoccaceae bacterium]|jgi:D-alanyl-D-alanine carboxypeptidase (penicillin-binding protein 5/6)|nr:serine-type D-Ala-D-Ala carboxypeptidase [Porticoccaceae bacterium]